MAINIFMSVAIIGGIDHSTLSSDVPMTPDEIAEQSISAAKAGL